MTGSIDSNLVEHVPKIRVRWGEHIPSVWKSADLVKAGATNYLYACIFRQLKPQPIKIGRYKTQYIEIILLKFKNVNKNC
jgi:hypothetical protein